MFAVDSLRRLDFVKVDVEGSELAFLRGARETLRTHRPILVVECNPVPLGRFHGATSATLAEEIRAIYGSVGYVSPDGVAVAVSGSNHLEMLIARYGLVDLVAGIPFVGGRRALGERKRSAIFRVVGRPRIARLLRRFRPRYRPTPAYLTGPSCQVRLVRSEIGAAAGEDLDVAVEIVNHGPAWLGVDAPGRTVVAVVLLRGGGGTLVGESHAALVDPVVPGDVGTVAIPVNVPETPGRYAIEATLLQQGHAWLNELDPATSGTGALVAG